MTNNQVVWAFINGNSGKSLNMRTDGIKLWSYNTVMAQRIHHKSLSVSTSMNEYDVIFNTTKYSRTTSKQVSGLKGYCDLNTKKQVPYGTQDLTDYL